MKKKKIKQILNKYEGGGWKVLGPTKKAFQVMTKNNQCMFGYRGQILESRLDPELFCTSSKHKKQIFIFILENPINTEIRWVLVLI